jgi:hypothetical protein
MNPVIVSRPLIVDQALQIRELAKHGTHIEGIACSLFTVIYERAEVILSQFSGNEPGGE